MLDYNVVATERDYERQCAAGDAHDANALEGERNAWAAMARDTDEAIDLIDAHGDEFCAAEQMCGRIAQFIARQHISGAITDVQRAAIGAFAYAETMRIVERAGDYFADKVDGRE